MEISAFLLPKDQVAYITSSISMLEAMEQLEQHYYSAIPIIDHEGKYVGTLAEGDLLWKLKNTAGLSFDNMREVKVSDIQRHVHNESVYIKAQMEDMLTLAADQNFVPVVDREGVFLGIIRRKDIIEYYTRNITD
ncbi:MULTISPECIES: CBS domain-containing protein [unclassified Paenibacillus]|uniref:CBS domain-containing protein n=1 Tax=unclassified Paenibacillus TaxID=185978 RepID=UPI00240669AE|nr:MULTISPECIES: CBS domain-containing protein [unclassified Paenibacillus]MDF9844820.1 CBS-domain-containing membrane protein [Paenibacillus sp. PastF-2]MDF9851379.1 CBS-domain-containing membrane protein [Paenibacillus sp. PastM-2]MDF9858004.1 CBS-domain-containing membrane protein [Paenibacillus sp. PastF-1]MDH6483272.1 CBS-domain-containing membrane protein [Paenibacillus sp. PastH-2]MDH6510682.1 CBS-domain-containing membrane protein [Paenibacillus sp. PastM-3]